MFYALHDQNKEYAINMWNFDMSSLFFILGSRKIPEFSLWQEVDG